MNAEEELNRCLVVGQRGTRAKWQILIPWKRGLLCKQTVCSAARRVVTIRYLLRVSGLCVEAVSAECTVRFKLGKSL